MIHILCERINYLLIHAVDVNAAAVQNPPDFEGVAIATGAQEIEV